MKLYNTLNKRVETFNPQQPPHATIYTCGPTVYDYPHIGNWFTFIRYDLLVRVLKLNQFRTDWVMNVTDVGHLVSDADEGEDKLEKGARREGKTAWQVAEFYTENFLAGLRKLNMSQPDHLTKATEHIQEQIALVQTLADKGFTYTIDDGVYFDTAAFPQYADFAQLDIDEQQAGKRVAFNEAKRNPTDFALWKFSPRGQQRDMEWDSPFLDADGQTRKGFPGWHVECSAMAMKYLGNTVDIHAGGIDHIPVHHTNEIAQSQAATGQPFANYWMHANHITIEGEKISKSLGNGITLEDLEKQGYSARAFRLHVLESHYRSQSKFSWDALAAATNRLANVQAFADLRFQINGQAESVPPDNWHAWQTAIAADLSNDLDTPAVLHTIAGLIDVVGQRQLTEQDATSLSKLVTFLDQALGLQLGNSHDITEDQRQLITQRETARQQKDWNSSDTFRDTLAKQGVGLRDTALGAVWYRL